MTEITTKDIEQLADLARMKIPAEEIETVRGQIASILNYVSQVSDVSGERKDYVPPLHNVMREDVPQHSGGEYTEKILNNAPTRDGAYVVVKKILI